jgi:hypothetical protein
MTKQITSNDESWMGMFTGKSFWQINKTICMGIGLTPTLLLAELSSRWEYRKKRGELKDGYFFRTKEKIEEETFLSPYQQGKALELLKKLNLVETKMMGVPCKMYYKINIQNISHLQDFIVEYRNSQFLKNLRTSHEEIKELVLKKLNDSYNKNINKKNRDKSSKDDIAISQKSRESFSLTIKPYLDYWYEKGFTVKHGRQTKTYKKAKQFLFDLINGKLFENVPNYEDHVGREFTLNEWKQSVNNYELVFDKSFSPADKSKLARPALDSFLFNERAKDGNYSRFIKYLTYTPKRLEQNPGGNPYPKTVQLLQKKLNLKTVNINLVNASIRIEKFFAKHDHKLDGAIKGSSKRKVDLCFNVADDMENIKLSTNLFLQEWYYERVHKWLDDRGYLLTRRR